MISLHHHPIATPMLLYILQYTVLSICVVKSYARVHGQANKKWQGMFIH